MKNTIIKKLQSNSGESIAETLVAVLISAFALLMLAGTINTASNLITKGQDSMEAYYAGNNVLADSGGPSMTVEIKAGVNGDGKSLLSASATGHTVESNIGGKVLISYH